MGINNPLGNINNAGWNLPANTPANNNQQLKMPTYNSGFPDIDAFLNTTAQYANNTINNTINNMGLNSSPIVDKINNNQSLNTQNLFSLMGAGQTVGYNNNVIFRNTIDSFTSKDATTVLPTDKPINSEVKTGELTMEQLFAQIAKSTTEDPKTSATPPLTVDQIIKNYPNAVAGPTGAVFGRTSNSLGLPEAATQTNNPAFLSDLGSLSGLSGLSGLSKEKAAALATIANLYPELAQSYLQNTANKATPMANVATNQTATGTNFTGTNFTGMPSGFNQLYKASVQPLGQLNQADAAQLNETMRLIGEAFKATFKDLPKS